MRRDLVWWSGASLALMAIGAFGPWAKVFGLLSVSGTDGGDGWIVIGLAVAAGIFLWRFSVRRRRLWPALMLLAAIGGAFTSGYDLNNLNSLASADTFFGAEFVHAGWGVYLDLIASISLGVAAIVLLRQPRPARPVAIEIPPASGLDEVS
jgi:MYXO-CTERM domain-containing protein